MTRAAYLLFYRRREVFVPPPSIVSIEAAEEEDEYESASSEIEEMSQVAGKSPVDGPSKLVIDMSEMNAVNEGFVNTVAEDSGAEKVHEEETTVIVSDDEDLGYTDMDSVD